MTTGTNHRSARPPGRPARGLRGARASRSGRAVGARAFTLIEVLVAIAIVLVIVAIVVTGFRGAVVFARQSADRQAIAAMGTAVANFEAAYGFLPPLVHDGSTERGETTALMAGSDPENPSLTDADGPIIQPAGNLVRVSVYSESVARDRAFLEARDLPAEGLDVDRSIADERYSKFTVAYYLAGVLPETLDGREGPGYAEPQPDGSFGSAGERRYQFAPGGGPALRDGFLEADGSQLSIQPRYVDPVEYREHGRVAPADPDADDSFDIDERIAVVDSNGKAFRYYRWRQPEDASLETALGASPDDPGFMPTVLIDPLLVELRHGQALTFDEIRTTRRGLVEVSLNPAVLSARYAIVGAGQNGVFGTEAIEDILEALDRDAAEAPGLTAEATTRLRREAWEDNLVELGR